jgi:hypothetical protein
MAAVFHALGASLVVVGGSTGIPGEDHLKLPGVAKAA